MRIPASTSEKELEGRPTVQNITACRYLYKFTTYVHASPAPSRDVPQHAAIPGAYRNVLSAINFDLSPPQSSSRVTMALFYSLVLFLVLLGFPSGIRGK